MPSNYKRLGDYIQEVNIRNRDLNNIPLLGVSIRKVLIPSIANINGTDMSTYKLIQKNQFAYGPVTSRNGDKISIALLEEYDNAIVSQAYTVFEVIDEGKLLPEYLMMWFRRHEFDRYARFMSHGSAREIFSWTEMCETELPIPSIEKQNELVKEYNTIQNRIALNNKLIRKLEETAQAIYKQWFVDFEFPDENGKPYKSNGGKVIWCEQLKKEYPTGWEIKSLRELFTIIDNRGKTPICSEIKTIYPLIEIGAIRNDNRVIDFSKCDKYISERTYNSFFRAGHPVKKDILFSTVGSLAEMKIFWDQLGSIAQNIVGFRSNDNVGLFLYQTLCNLKNDLISYEIGSVQASIKVSQIIDYKIIFPKMILIKKFENLSEILTNKMVIYSKQNIKLLELKEMLLAKMTRVEKEIH